MTTTLIPNLWFDGNSEEAAEFYCSVFKNSRIITKTYYPEGSNKAGEVVTVDFELDGNRFVAINGGPQFKFNEAVSFMVPCEDQEEIDYYWDRLVEGGGEHGPCGWLKDRYGLSWQVAPKDVDALFRDEDEERSRRAWDAMMGMSKLDIAALKAAADGVAV
jgi:predicted 3-demethylubiquinone-9 3-methyltransferase (glyoxalase superfamily)